jgi:capsular polysaccharide biosynthesis protein
MLTRDAKKPCR